jgi:hypothetical protein
LTSERRYPQNQTELALSHRTFSRNQEQIK